jgi:CDP-glucose 4,6-dehydratase
MVSQPSALSCRLATADFCWQGRRVFLTGHTGFKGGWLALWLHQLGTQVHGYALAPPTEPNFFTIARVAQCLASHTLADVRDLDALETALQRAQPEVVLHLAAQPLVRHSYVEPLETWAVNVMGTAHLLDAVRRCPSVRAVLIVTTDKCYENREWVWPYREHEALGGHDPYSSSKAGAELVTAAWRRSFLAEAGVRVASARAGNVIGGGDWAADRLLPDCLRALDAGLAPQIRHPDAIRPWQHVFEPLSGYLRLADALCGAEGEAYAQAWNFGPAQADARPVRWIVEQLWQAAAQRLDREGLGGTLPPDWAHDAAPQPHEAHTLKLDSTLAHVRLGWWPRWDLATALTHTLDWHLAWRSGADMAAISRAQIEAYTQSP